MTTQRAPDDLLVHLRRARDHADRHHKTYEELKAKGVEFLQEPSDRPYGVEAVCRDNSGNWMVLVQQWAFTGEDFPHS